MQRAAQAARAARAGLAEAGAEEAEEEDEGEESGAPVAASQSSPTGAKLDPETSISKSGLGEEAAGGGTEEAEDETGSDDEGDVEEVPFASEIKSTLLATIWLVVSVPVLSEQITVVQPKVSTAGKERTMAFFLACLLKFWCGGGGGGGVF